MEDMPCPTRILTRPARIDRERYRRLTKECLASGMCPKCGRESLPPDRRLCHACGEKKRKAERARYARAKAQGRLYGGRDPENSPEDRAGEKQKALSRHIRDAGLCTRCGNHSSRPGTVRPAGLCRDERQAAERELYAARRAEGMCGRCGRPSFDRRLPLRSLRHH